MIGPKLSHSLTDIAGVPAAQLEDAIRIYRAHYLSTGIAQSRLYPGIRDLLEAYVAAGRPIAVATQKPEGLARTVLEHHGIAGLFHTIRGSAADEAGSGRPTARPGQARPASSPPPWPTSADPADAGRAVMVGDRAQDVAGAAANGLDCIGVGWGFAPDGELHDGGCRRDRAQHHGASRDDQQTLRTARGPPALNEVHTDGNV